MTKKRNYFSGQSLAEFALVVPLVIFAFTTFFDVGRAIYYYSTLSNSVREGTRYAIVHPMDTSADKAAIEQVVKDYAIGIKTSDVSVAITPPSGTNDNVKITATYLFKPVTPGLAMVLGSSTGITLKAESSMEVAPINR
jgi:Flp pilus assembly protein TadG